VALDAFLDYPVIVPHGLSVEFSGLVLVDDAGYQQVTVFLYDEFMDIISAGVELDLIGFSTVCIRTILLQVKH